MRTFRTWGPLWLWPVTLGIVAWLAHAGWQLRRENVLLQSAPAPSVAAAAEIPAVAPEPASGPTLSLESLAAETQREAAALSSAEAKIGELKKRLPGDGSDVLVSFGSIAQLAQRAATAAPLLAEQGSGDSRRSTDASLAAMELFARESGLRALENEPREIAEFLATTLGNTLGLAPDAAQRAGAILEAEFARLREQGLTAAFRPDIDPAEWETRRDAAIVELASRLRPLLPAEHERLLLVPGILNLGGGVRPAATVESDGRVRVKLIFPLFPGSPEV